MQMAIGLFLTRFEFDDFITLRYPSTLYAFDSSFLDLIYDLAVGRVGAIDDLITLLLVHDLCPLSL